MAHSHSPVEQLNKSHRFSAALAVAGILALNALVLSMNAFRDFRFHDMGPFLDASWRIYIGQRPYVDFFYYSGPVHLYLNAFFFHLFGFGKSAILTHLIAVHSAVIVLTFFIARKHTSLWISIICTILSATCFYWPVSHPWHNQTAHLWGLFSIGTLFFNIPFRSRRTAFWTTFLSGVFCGLALMSKMNLGAAYTLIALAVLLSADFRKFTIPSFAIGTFLLMATMLVSITDPRLAMEQIFSYGNQVSRVRIPKLLSLKIWFVNDYWVFVIIILANILRHSKMLRTRPFRQHLILLIGIYFTGIIALETDTMSQEINIFLWGIIASFAFIAILQLLKECTYETHRLLHPVSLILLALFSISLIVKSTYHGINITKWSFLNRIGVGDYTIKSQPFQGWLCNKEQGEAFDELVGFINHHIPRDDSLLILTDMQILYSITGRDSYRGITFNFFADPKGYLPVPGRQQKKVTENILNNPPNWIITHDRNREYKTSARYVASLVSFLELTEFIDSSYEIVKEAGAYQVLRRKPA